ncbi:hypothetical protein [Bifidobacterium anseris]|uniref:hypothetical protein n=1 Tax=Bifidobacterium anseris TaxID=2020963 RepID=UPI0013FD65EB|nr:hypothetical protein [Bifidobacterium anseris]
MSSGLFLRGVMLRGEGFLAIGVDLLVLCGFLLVFFVLGALGFRKKHAHKHTEPSIR